MKRAAGRRKESPASSSPSDQSSQSENRADGGANDVGLGPATNGVVGSPFAHGELLKAVRAGDVKRVKLLLKRGADVDEPDEGGWTPLLYAVWEGHLDAIKLGFGE